MGIIDSNPLAGLMAAMEEEPSSSLDFLQKVYRDATMPLHTRMRAAIAAIPFEHPKLAVTAVLPDDGRFAEQLEKALARSGQVLELRANGEQFEIPRAAPAMVAVRRR